MGYHRWSTATCAALAAFVPAVFAPAPGAAQEAGVQARVELEVAVAPELAERGIALREVRLDFGRVRSFTAEQLRTLEGGGTVVPYVGVLPALAGGVVMEVEGDRGGEAVALRQGVRLLLREGERVRVGLVLSEGPDGLVLRPELRSWQPGTLSPPRINPAATSALQAQAGAEGALAVAAGEFLAGRYLFAASRAAELLEPGEEALAPEQRRIALYLRAASALRTGDLAAFHAVEPRLDALEGSPLGDLLALETALAALAWPELEPAGLAAAGRLVQSGEGSLAGLAALALAALGAEAPAADRARLYARAAALEGQVGALAAYEAGRSWRLAERPDSAARTFAGAVAKASASAAPEILAVLARVGEAEARVTAGEPAAALELLDGGMGFLEERTARLLEERRSTMELLELTDRLVDLEIRIGSAEDYEAIAPQVATELTALGARYRELGAPGEDRLALDFMVEEGSLAWYKVRSRALFALGRFDEADATLLDGLSVAGDPARRAVLQVLRAHFRMERGEFAEALDILASARVELETRLGERRAVRTVSRAGILVGDPTDADDAVPPLVADVGALARARLDSLAGALLPTAPFSPADAFAGHARRAGVPGSRVREGVWALGDVELRTAQEEVLAVARARAALRTLDRLGASGGEAPVERVEERLRARLEALAGAEAVEAWEILGERVATLDGVAATSGELAGVETLRLSLAADAPVITTRAREAVTAQLEARRRQRRLMKGLERILDLHERLIASWKAPDRAERARAVAAEARRIVDALGSDIPRGIEGGAGIRVAHVAAPEEALERFARAEAALVSTSGGRVVAALERLHRAEEGFRTGAVPREEAVAVARGEMEAAFTELERETARLAQRRRSLSAATAEAVTADGPPVRPVLAQGLRPASGEDILELLRFGEAGAAFAAAMEGDHPVGSAVALHELFLEHHPRSPWRARVFLQLAELHVRDADARFAEGMRSGSDEPGAPAYGDALATLERALPELEGERRLSALLSLGALYFQEGRNAEAAESFEAWVAGVEEPSLRAEGLFRQADAVFAMALDSAGAGRTTLLDEAAALYTDAAQATTDTEVRLLALYKLGWARYLQNRYADARDAFGRLLDLNAGLEGEAVAFDLEEEVTRYAAVALSQMEDPRAELNMFSAVRPEDYNFPTYQTLAETLLEQGRTSEAMGVLVDFQGLRALEEQAMEAQSTGVEMLEGQGLAERAQQARIDLVDRYGPDSRWWQVNPEFQDTARILTERALRYAAHWRMAGADEEPEDFPRAAELYLRYTELFPRSDSARALHYLAGEALFEAGDLIAAGDAYLAAAFRYEAPPEARRQAAVNAVAAYQAALQRASSEARGERAAERLYRAANRLVDAFPGSEDARLALRAAAETAFERGDGAEAFAALHRYLETWPDASFAPRARKLLGDLAYREGNAERAMGIWRRAEAEADSTGAGGLAEELMEMRTSVTLSLADSLAESGRPEEAAELYLTFARERTDDPRAPLAYTNAADLLIEMGERERAVEVLAELAEAHPDHERTTEATVLRAEILADLDRTEESIAVYGELAADADAGVAADALLRRAELQVDAGDVEAAADSYLRFARSHEADERAPDALRTAARMLEDEGLRTEAEAVWEEYLQRFPGAEGTLDAAARLVDLRQDAPAPDPDLDDAYERLLELAEGAPTAEVEPHRGLIGEAHLRRARRLWDEYAAIRFAPPALTEQALLDERARKDAALEALVENLDRAVATGAPAAVSEGLWRLGEADLLYAEYIEDVRLPEGTPEQVVEVVRQRTAELAVPYRERAAERWARLVELAEESADEMDLDPETPGFQNRWVEQAREALDGGLDDA